MSESRVEMKSGDTIIRVVPAAKDFYEGKGYVEVTEAAPRKSRGRASSTKKPASVVDAEQE